MAKQTKDVPLRGIPRRKLPGQHDSKKDEQGGDEPGEK